MNWFGLDLRWAYTDLLGNIAYKSGCPHRAKDILHDAILCFVFSDNPSRIQSPHAYLRGIVSHLLVDEHRYASKFVEVDTVSHEVQAHSPSAEHLADIRQRLNHLQRIIDNLPARCREVFWMFHVHGMSHKDIALQLGISVNMVERHIIRAMLDLRAARQSLLQD